MNYENPSEPFVLFNAYWWLIIVLVAMGFGLVKTILAHRRANRGLDILKSYIDQGKEPPAELTQYLRAPPATRRDRDRGPGRDFFLAILFLGLAAAFSFNAVSQKAQDVYFVAIIMGALALGFVVKGLMNRSQENRRDLP